VGFEPELLGHNDNDGLDPRALEGVPCWLEVRYSNGMDAKICLEGRLEEPSTSPPTNCCG
jgi:hypothetical protein